MYNCKNILMLCLNFFLNKTFHFDCFKYLRRGRVDDLSFFEYLSSFCFLSIEFHSTFSISYKILPHFVYYYCILIRM